MNENGKTNFIYLNRENHWPDFYWQGLELREDGALQLFSVPMLEQKLLEEVASLPTPDRPAGIAIAADDTIYYSHPATHRLLKIDPCDSTLTPVPCMGGEGNQPTQFHEPRGILFHPVRQILFVADSGNHRIQLFNPHSWQLVGIWGQPDPTGEPQPGDAPGYFNTPQSLASDAAGNVYVVDYGNRRVQKFDLRGNVIPGFWDTVLDTIPSDEASLSQPSEVASDRHEEFTEVYILDTEQKAIFVFDTEGHFRRSFNLSVQSSLGTSILEIPMGIAVTDGVLYVGDNERRRLFKFTAGGTFVGTAQGYEGPVAALAVDRQANLWLHPGSDLAPLRLSRGKAYVKSGVLWGGLFSAGEQPVQWHQLKALAESLAVDAHLQLFWYTANDTGSPPDPVSTNAIAPFRNENDFWQSLPLDVIDGLILGQPAKYLWVGAHFSSEGRTSPLLHQIRVDYNRETYTKYLPAIYRQPSVHRETLERLLSLFESFFAETEADIASLSKYFDPEAVQKDWLPWLASWLDLELNENWSDRQQRDAIARAFASYGRRGTVGGLRKALHFYAGVDAHIEEPLLNASWWTLPSEPNASEPEIQNSRLGFTTMLVSAEAQGAVVGTTAVLDRSHLIRQEEFGTPLFEELAHQFTVQVYRGQIRCSQDLEPIRAAIEREKPAHTTYQLCIIEPRMRVGFQARVGIDTVVAGAPAPTKLGEPPASNTQLVLGGESAGRIGKQSRIGQRTRLG